MKTTILGVLTIVVAAANVVIGLLRGDSVDFAAAVTAITAGIGLIKAADHN
jgi:hypothetical protein